MHRSRLASRLFFAFILLATCSSSNAQQALDNASVVKLAGSGLSEDIVLQAINSSTGNYDTSAEALIALKKSGVTDKEISAILTKKTAGSSATTAGSTHNAADSLPLSKRLAAAHKVFVTEAGDADNETTQRAYDAISTALQKVNGYVLAASPSQADLDFKLHCITTSTVYNGQSMNQRFVKLTVLDPMSHDVLWTISERGPSSAGMAFVGGSGGAWGKNFDKVAAKLSEDLKKLSSGS